jgi:hypothetical protein
MNHKLLRMLNEAGFEFTPDIMAKLPAFENLVWLEREECAKVCDAECNPTPNEGNITTYQSGGYIMAEYLASAIRARGQHGD